jgi:hypothetical protein
LKDAERNLKKNNQINITVSEAFTQSGVFEYVFICDSLQKKYQDTIQVDPGKSLFMDSSNIKPKSHSNFYHDVQKNLLLSKISF